jgi:hydrogenase maturation protein HypF
MTSSIGRLFDAVASVLNVCQISAFEGQAAMALEQLAMREQNPTGLRYPLTLIEGELLLLDWQPLLLALLADLPMLSPAHIAAKFHHTLANVLFTVVKRVMPPQSETPIVLSGGCFQNAYLVQAIETCNQQHQYRLFRQQQIPPNDGGIALGQIFAATLR